MAFTSETVSSLSDLVSKLNTWMAASAGFTSDHLDVTTTAGTGGEWAMNKIESVPAAVTAIDGTTMVDDVNEELDLTGHGFSDGQFVLYSNGGGTTITGLTDDTHYYVHWIDANTISLHLTKAEALADANRIGLTDTVTSVSSLTPIGWEIRFAASWDAANSGTKLAIYQYAHQAYVIADRPWGQDHDSGNGAATTLEADIEDSRHVNIGAAPQQYWAFEGDDYCHVVVQTGDTTFEHFGFGVLDKLNGDWIGGEYAYGQRDNIGGFTSGSAFFDGWSLLLDGMLNDTSDAGGQADDSELHAATIRCERMPNQVTNGMWGVNVGGKRLSGGSPQTDFGFDRQSNDGASSDTAREHFTWGVRGGPFANGFYRMMGSDVSGHTSIWPIATCYVDQTTGDIHGWPTGRMKDIGCINIENYEAAQEITLAGGTETWMVFPGYKKWTSSGVENNTAFLGIAYKKVA